MPNKEVKKMTYERALIQLEDIIQKMENGNIPLTELVSKYEKGNELLKYCQNELKDAELKLKSINIDDGSVANFEE